MTYPAQCKVLGRWLIFASDTWDEDYLDLLEHAAIALGAESRGELAVGDIQASLDLEYSRSVALFRFAGFNEKDEMTGSGLAELGDDGSLEIQLSFDNGDDVLLTVRRDWLFQLPAVQLGFTPSKSSLALSRDALAISRP